jgi:hypothetical protein
LTQTIERAKVNHGDKSMSDRAKHIFIWPALLLLSKIDGQKS